MTVLEFCSYLFLAYKHIHMRDLANGNQYRDFVVVNSIPCKTSLLTELLVARVEDELEVKLEFSLSPPLLVDMPICEAWPIYPITVHHSLELFTQYLNDSSRGSISASDDTEI